MADFISQYLHSAAVAAGLPVIGVCDNGPGATPRFRVDLGPTGSQAQQSQADSLAAGFDVSPTAQAGYALSAARLAGSAYVAAPLSGPNDAFRGFLVALVDELNTMITTVNQLVNYANAHSGSISPLATITKAAVVNAINAKISAGSAD